MNRAHPIVWPALLALMLLFSAARAQGTSPEALQERFEAANALYRDEAFQQALEAYRALHRDGVLNPQVLANAGNAAYRAGHVGEAVLFYKRALRQQPDYPMARQNLALVEPSTNLLESAGLTDLIARWFQATPRGVWLALAELTFLAFLGTLLFYGRSEPHSDARAAWGSRLAWMALLLAATAGLLSFHLSTGDGDAVVIIDKTITRSGPGEDFFQQLELPAGTVLDLVRSPERGWVQFKLVDGRSGYIPTEAVEGI